jgi:hypothetical protein
MRWFCFYGFLDITNVVESAASTSVQFTTTAAQPFDCVGDDGTISEKAAVGLLWVFLTLMAQGAFLFDEGIRGIALSIDALLRGATTGDIRPGKVIMPDTAVWYWRTTLSGSLEELLNDMLCEDPGASPAAGQCLAAPLFATQQGKVAVDDIRKRLPAGFFGASERSQVGITFQLKNAVF